MIKKKKSKTSPTSKVANKIAPKKSAPKVSKSTANPALKSIQKILNSFVESDKKVGPLTRPSQIPGATCIEQPNGLVAVLPEDVSNYFYVLDGYASDCFQLFNGKKTIAEIAAKVAKANDVPSSLVEKDLVNLVEELLEIKIVTTT